MTTNEFVGITSVVVVAVSNAVALAWGAAKMSSKVEQVGATLSRLEKEFHTFLVDHKRLEKVVGTHSTAIALLAQANELRLRRTDLDETLGQPDEPAGT